ncbi:unnamed protein product, partial [Ixodes persulcatus]
MTNKTPFTHEWRPMWGVFSRMPGEMLWLGGDSPARSHHSMLPEGTTQPPFFCRARVCVFRSVPPLPRENEGTLL